MTLQKRLDALEQKRGQRARSVRDMTDAELLAIVARGQGRRPVRSVRDLSDQELREIIARGQPATTT